MARTRLPQARRNWVERRRLHDALTAAQAGRTVFLIAGAGCGKTGLVAAHGARELAQGMAEVLYAGLSEAEAEPRALFETLAQSIAERIDGPASALDPASGDSPAEFARLLCDTVAARPPGRLLWIIEDLHAIERSEPSVRLISALARRLDDDATLILTSRSLPRRGLGALAADASFIGPAIFRLTDTEARALLSQHAGGAFERVDDALVARLQIESGGWLQGARLIVQGWQSSLKPAQIQDILDDYLRENVLAPLPSDVRAGLMRASLLDTAERSGFETAAAWDAVCAQLAEAERRQLFVEAREDGGGFRFWQAFQDLLRRECRAEAPQQHAEWQRSAGRALARAGQASRAIAHFLAGDDGRGAIELLTEHLTPFATETKPATLEEWAARIEALEPGATLREPIVARLSLIAAARRERFDAVAGVLDGWRDRPASADRADWRDAWRAALHWHLGDLSAATEAAFRFISRPAPGMWIELAEALRIALAGRVEQGRLADAATALEDAERRLGGEHRDAHAARAALALAGANARSALGDVDAALRLAADAVTYATAAHDAGVATTACLAHADRLAEAGDFSNATRALALAGEWAGRAARPEISLRVALTRAAFASLAGRFDQSVEAGRALLTEAREGDGPTTVTGIVFDALEHVAHCLCLRAAQRRDRHQALDDLSEARMLASELEEIAAASDSVRARLRAARVLGACRAIGGDAAGARAVLDRASADAGAFRDETVGGIAAWRLYLDSDPESPGSAAAIRASVEAVNDLQAQRRSNFFIKREGDPVYARYLAVAQPVEQQTAASPPAAPAQPNASALIADVSPTRLMGAEPSPRVEVQAGHGDAPLRVFGFGTGRALLKGELITVAQWGWSIPRELLIYMLTVREATRERIGGVFWPDASTATMQRGFHNAKFTIRTVVGKPPLVYLNGVYSINPELDYWYDVREFDEALANVTHAATDDVIPLLLRAADLYTDEFMAGSSLEWAASTRQRLHVRFVKCCLDLGGAALQHMRVDDAVMSVIERAFHKDSRREDLARMLMRLQWHIGRRSDAMDTYKFFTSTTQRDVAVKPDAETEALIAEIRADRRPA